MFCGVIPFRNGIPFSILLYIANQKIVQHSNNIFATCNSALLPLHEKADLLSILQGYNTVAPVGSQFFIVCNDHNGLALCFELLQ